MDRKTKEEIDQLLEVWDSQGEGKITFTKDKNGEIRYFITKGGKL